MNAQLIMLPEPILVSDEQANIGEYDYSVNYKTVTSVDKERYQTHSLPAYKGMYKRVIAGLPDLPKLDLSLIADEIGWVDVDKLAKVEYLKEYNEAGYGDYDNFPMYLEGFKAAQSLNDKKYSEEDIEQFYIWKDENRWFNFSNGKWNYTFEHGTAMSESSYEKNYRKTTKELMAIWLKQRKPKEYLVEVEMEDKIALDGHTVIGKEPTITNNSITVTKILNHVQ